MVFGVSSLRIWAVAGSMQIACIGRTHLVMLGGKGRAVSCTWLHLIDGTSSIKSKTSHTHVCCVPASPLCRGKTLQALNLYKHC